MIIWKVYVCQVRVYLRVYMYACMNVVCVGMCACMIVYVRVNVRVHVCVFVSSHPFAEADDWPQTEAQGAAAAEAATEQPADVHREGLPKAAIHPVDAGLELLGGHLTTQATIQTKCEPTHRRTYATILPLYV